MDIEAFVPAKISEPDAEGERERLRQTQELLGLDLVGGAGSQQRLQQPELQVGDAGSSSSGPGESDPSSLWSEGPPNRPESSMSFWHRFLARRPVAPGRQHPALYLGRREIVLECQQSTDDLGGVSEERVCQRRHSPMQPDSLLSRDRGQQSPRPGPAGRFSLDGMPLQIRRMMPTVLALDSLPGNFVLQVLIQERAQFRLVGRLSEPIQHGIEPRPLDLPVDSDDLPHALSLVIATNGTMTSSRAIPPWDTTSSPTSVNAFRSPARRTYRAGGRP